MSCVESKAFTLIAEVKDDSDTDYCQTTYLASYSNETVFVQTESVQCNRRLLLVQGPYGYDADGYGKAHIPWAISEIKRTCCPELNTITVELWRLIPDLFKDQPIGFRRQLYNMFSPDNNIECVFLTFENVLEGDLTTDEKIVDFAKLEHSDVIWYLDSFVHSDLLDQQAIEQLAMYVMFRWIVGCPPMERRDLMWVTEKKLLYGLNETDFNVSTTITCKYSPQTGKLECELT